MIFLGAQEANYNAGQHSGQKKQYCVQSNMSSVKNNTTVTSFVNFDDQSLAKKSPEDFQHRFSHTFLA